MRVLTSTAAIAALMAGLATTAMPVSAATRTPAAESGGGTTFDLGLDVSGIVPTAQDVGTYMAGLDPSTQAAILGACNTFVQNPVDVRSIDTLPFCKVAVGNPPTKGANVKAFASASPIIESGSTVANSPTVVAPTAPPMTNGSSGNRYRVFPSDSAKGSF
jgi:hypothetical protein